MKRNIRKKTSPMLSAFSKVNFRKDDGSVERQARENYHRSMGLDLLTDEEIMEAAHDTISSLKGMPDGCFDLRFHGIPYEKVGILAEAVRHETDDVITGRKRFAKAYGKVSGIINDFDVPVESECHYHHNSFSVSVFWSALFSDIDPEHYVKEARQEILEEGDDGEYPCPSIEDRLNETAARFVRDEFSDAVSDASRCEDELFGIISKAAEKMGLQARLDRSVDEEDPEEFIKGDTLFETVITIGKKL